MLSLRNNALGLHPITKIYLLLSIILLGLTGEFWAQFFLLTALLGIIILACRPFPWKKLFYYLGPFIMFIFILNSFFFPEAEHIIFFFDLQLKREGIIFATKVSLRLLIFILSISVFFTLTPPSTIAESFLERRIDPRWTYILLYSLQLVEIFKKRIRQILEAQTSRGLVSEGSIPKRVRNFFPMILPLIFSSIAESIERSLALELRGFTEKANYTSLKEIPMTSWEKFLGKGILFGAIVLTVIKAIEWLFLS